MPQSHPKQRLAAGVIALLFILTASIGATLKINIPPKPVGADAPQDQFSAGRAMALIEEFAQKPHPFGTVENLRVQGVLTEALEELGYEVFVQDQPIFRGHSIARAANVYARLPGTNSTGAIAMCAHFDSVPYGPGAADDGSGVAAIIETARVLKHSEPLQNDVIFLLTDAEEVGLLGPRTFLEHNPWRDDLKLVINFEARGHYGPSMMYLTWPGNENTIRHFVEGASHPVASSVMFDFAGALPTSSDYYVFKAEGYPGFDLAYVGGLKYYHTPNDSAEKLSMRSLQHHGEYGVSLTKHFGNVDLNTLLEDPDKRAVYFNTVGHHMVWYSAKWIWPISLFALFISIVALALGVARKRTSIGGVLAGALTFLVPLILTPILAIVPVYYGLVRFGPYALYNQHWYFAGFCFLLLAVFALVYAIATRMLRAESLAAGALAVLLPVLVLGTMALPMGSFFFSWPVIGLALGLLLLFLLPDSESPWPRLVAGAIGATPALVLMSPFALMLTETFTFLMGPPMLLVAGLILAFAVIPLTVMGMAPRLGFGVPIAAALLALAAFGIAIADNRFTPDRPKMNYLLYGANYTDGTALYATLDIEIDEWLEQFFAEDDERGPISQFAPFDSREFRLAEAPLADFDLGTAEVLEDVIDGDARRLTLFIQAGHETAEYYLWTGPAAGVRSVLFNGEPWETSDRLPVAQWFGQIRGRFDEGITLEFELDAGGEPFELTFVEQTYGLPKIEGIEPRPDWMIPMSNTMPVAWDFSRERLLGGNLVRVLQFDAGSRSTHIYARQDLSFPPPAAESAEPPEPEELPDPEAEDLEPEAVPAPSTPVDAV